MIFTKKILDNNNKIRPIEIDLDNLDLTIELIPIGYTGKNNNNKDSK